MVDPMTADPTLLSRVRKLLALAASPNVHEAATAASVAQTLIARHRLQGWLDAEAATADDPDPIVDARDTPLEASKRLRKWKVVLATALADVNGCVAYTLDRGKDQAIVLIGRGRDRDAVRALWDWLLVRVELLSATHGANHDKAWHEAFRIGCVDTIAQRLRHVAVEVRAELSEQALVRVDPAVQAEKEALEQFVASRMRFGKGRGIRVQADAWEAGRQAAEGLALGPSGSGNTGGLKRHPHRSP